MSKPEAQQGGAFTERMRLRLAVFQPANAPLVFNSIEAGEKIMQQIEAIRRQRWVSSD